jgi:SAM-dependent methyltransferase
MPAPEPMYEDASVAAGYAFARPPVHERILALLDSAAPARRALDLGCGAGRSTAALAPYAHFVVGLEPAAAMLAHRREVAPGAHFITGTAESLPFSSSTFDLVTAAGSLNYTVLTRALAEASRVLAAGGRLVIYDFSEGRRCPVEPRLAAWFDAFELRCPWPPGYAPLPIAELGWSDFGLELQSYDPVLVTVEMSVEAYTAYVLSEVNAGAARQRGADPATWCRETLAEVFAGRTLPIEFNGYLAVARNPRA